MSTPGPGRRVPYDNIDDHPLQGGLTGIALVAVATLGLAAGGALIVWLALLIVG